MVNVFKSEKKIANDISKIHDDEYRVLDLYKIDCAEFSIYVSSLSQYGGEYSTIGFYHNKNGKIKQFIDESDCYEYINNNYKYKEMSDLARLVKTIDSFVYQSNDVYVFEKEHISELLNLVN